MLESRLSDRDSVFSSLKTCYSSQESSNTATAGLRVATPNRGKESWMVSKTRMVFALSLFFTSILLTATAWSQVQDGNLVGSVFDSTGAVLPGAKVELENTATGITATTAADPEGFYRFNNLLVGIY